jgi:hypothetical protein
MSDQTEPHARTSLHSKIRAHLERLVEANGGDEKVFSEALDKLDKVLKSDTPTTGVLLILQQILDFMERGYAAEQLKLDAEVAELDARQTAPSALPPATSTLTKG